MFIVCSGYWHSLVLVCRPRNVTLKYIVAYIKHSCCPLQCLCRSSGNRTDTRTRTHTLAGKHLYTQQTKKKRVRTDKLKELKRDEVKLVIFQNEMRNGEEKEKRANSARLYAVAGMPYEWTTYDVL